MVVPMSTSSEVSDDIRWFGRKSISFRNRLRRSSQLNERAKDELISLLSNSVGNQFSNILESSCVIPPKNMMLNGGSSTSKFKGVVSQSRGQWGAQIYANRQRLWLGTFKSESEAAMAYDSASMKLRNGITNRNFPCTDVTLHELSFQNQFNKYMVLAMIKDGSYRAKFAAYLSTQHPQGYQIAFLRNTLGTDPRPLFKKVLTPSDVGKLNRFVIPKKFALKFFPEIMEPHETNPNPNSVKGVELVFYDRSMRSWSFRYCYWHSSQSFVFTRGWNRFTKEKRLKSNDKVIFSCYDRCLNDQQMFIIDVEYDVRSRAIQEALQLRVSPSSSRNEEVESEGARASEGPHASSCNEPKKGIRLFGVQIVEPDLMEGLLEIN